MVVPKGRGYGTRGHQELAEWGALQVQEEPHTSILAWILGALFAGGETEGRHSAV